jgi:putative ABC transport system permease protein
VRAADLARVASVGLRTRRLRAALSALGIAIGVAAIVAVLGLSSSSKAGLLAEIDRLGTNLLTIDKGQTFAGESATLPLTARSMVGHMPGVQRVADVAVIEDAGAYRSPLVPEIETNGLSVQAASVGLPAVTATAVAQGRFLNAATATQPVAVLGAEAARRLGIGRVHRDGRIWVGGQWFAVVGILAPSELAPEIDTSVLVGYTAAQRFLGYAGTASGEATIGPPSKVYVRADTDRVEAVQALLARTANPEAPNEVDVSQPSDALTARAAAQGALDSLFLGLGAVALLVGAVGVANIMIIAVLERRSEIGLRRALGATRGQIRLQFLSEAILLALAGGAVGVGAGAIATAVYATSEDWAVVIPASAWAGGLVSAIVIGAIAGLAPAVRAARMSPTEALRSV